MKRQLAIALFTLCCLTSIPAFAYRPLSLGTSLDVALTTHQEGDRTDGAGFASLMVSLDWGITDNFVLSFGAGLPIAPGLGLSVPIETEYHFWGWRNSGIYTRAGVRGVLALMSVCRFDSECEVGQDRPEDSNPLYRGYGGYGDVGIGGQIAFSEFFNMFIEGAGLAGYLHTLKDSNGDRALPGVYWGWEIVAGMRFSL